MRGNGNGNGKLGAVHWWAWFLIGPTPVRVALLFAFAAIAVAIISISVVQGQVAENTVRVHVQDQDRRNAIASNVRARFDDCARLNEVRRGLRIVVSRSHNELPPRTLRRLFPKLPRTWASDADAIYRDELRYFADDNCFAYAERSLPSYANHPLP